MVGCSAAPVAHVTPAPVPVPVDAAIDAAPPALPGLGAACRDTCAPGLECARDQPQGYCTSSCEACDGGTCIDLWSRGERCLAKCTSDSACRVEEGYFCDPVWHACAIPNSTVILPRACAAPAREPFEITRLGEHALEPSLVLAADGTPVIAYERNGEILVAGREIGTGRTPRLARTPTGFEAIWLTEGALGHATSRDGVTWEAAPSLADPADDELGEPNLAGGIAMYSSHRALRIATSHHAVTPMKGARGSLVVSAGRVHVVTLDGSPLGGFGSADQRVEYSVNSGKPVAISGRDELLPYFFAAPQLAVDDRRGVVYVVYVRGGHDARWELVVVATQGKVSKRAVISDGCSIHLNPAIALDGKTGVLHVVYDDANGLSHATCVAGACAVRGQIASFAVSTSRFSAHALGEHTSLAIDERRRVLHAAWIQPDGVYRGQLKLSR